jgi:hypothetical protein
MNEHEQRGFQEILAVEIENFGGCGEIQSLLDLAAGCLDLVV